MSGTRKAAELLLPWSALIGGALGWGLSHQIGSNTIFDGCDPTALWLVLVVGILGLALTGVGALLSWRVRRRGEAESETRRFLALLTTLLAALLAIAIVLQTLSALVIASCFG
ncbi:MAG TPA: hypothetical protein VD887_01015 [Allosphingosinicella sp.]|nr:hypothetical protein [Allosphingosinicella sp.]